MIADILGVQKSTAKSVVYLNEKLRAKATRKRPPPGIPREVLQLCGSSLTSLPVEAHAPEDLESRLRTRPVSKWVLTRLRNSAHPAAGIHLHQWQSEADAEPAETAGEQEAAADHCCSFQAKSDYPAAAFNKKPHVARYTNSLYQKLIANLDPNWTRWETDYLFALVAQYDLRFLVVHDRYDPVSQIVSQIEKRKADVPLSEAPASGVKQSPQAALACMSLEALETLLGQVGQANPRPVSQLKERYYTIARRLVEHEHRKKVEALESRFTTLTASVPPENVELLSQQRTQLLAEARAELARHPLIKYHYDQALDIQRRTYLDQQYRAVGKHEDEELVAEVVKAELVPNKGKKRRQLDTGVKDDNKLVADNGGGAA